MQLYRDTVYMKSNKRIAVTFNDPVALFPFYNGKPGETQFQDDTSESSFFIELDLIVDSLSEYYNEVKSINATSDIYKFIDDLKEYRPDIVFNLVESVAGISSFESYIAGLYELLKFEYTGNNPQTLGNCLNKANTKYFLSYNNLSIPHFKIIKYKEAVSENSIKLKFPLITKLLKEDASIGISENSIITSYNQLQKQLDFLFSTYNQDVILEEYIDGREFNIAILGNEALPASEIVFDTLPEELPKIVTYEGKWIADSVYYKNTIPQCPAKISTSLSDELKRISLQAFNALGCRDYARVDIRLSQKNIPYIIEVNPNPDISTDSGFSRAAKSHGLAHCELLHTIAEFAIGRAKR